MLHARGARRSALRSRSSVASIEFLSRSWRRLQIKDGLADFSPDCYTLLVGILVKFVDPQICLQMRLSAVPFDQEFSGAPYIDIVHLRTIADALSDAIPILRLNGKRPMPTSASLCQRVCLKALQIVFRQRSPAD